MARNASRFVNFQTVELSKTLFGIQRERPVLADVSAALTTPNTTLDIQP